MDIASNLKSLEMPEDVTLIAVSKTKPASLIRRAYSAGQRDFGENYVQEAVSKIVELKDLDIRWHFIGHLQSNKARLAAEHFHMIQSLDSMKLAKRLDNACRELGKKLPVLFEVNIAGESQKSGVLKEELPNFVKYVANLSNLELKGLMCIPPFNENPEPHFREMKALYDRYKDEFNFSTLSMGMSSDYRQAIQYGSNMVRIGTKIFGARKP